MAVQFANVGAAGREGRAPITGICFDLFHTLVDVGAVPEHVGRYTADILGVDRAAWNAGCFGPLHDICRPTRHVETIRALAHSLDPSIPLPLIERAAEERQRRFDHSLRHVETETLAGLQALRERGVRLALVSNASSGEVSAWPDSPLAPLFDAAVFSWECGARKPEGPIYERALQALGLEASECLFVGDGGSDEHRGARTVGLRPVLITRYIAAQFSPQRLAARRAQVDWVVDTVADIEPLLEAAGT